VAGTDYTPTSGTLTFPAGVTSETVSVPITTVATGGPTKTFTLNLSNPVNATIADGVGIGSILNRMTKFFVADGGTPKTYQYGSGGTSEEIFPQLSGDSAPRGVATNAAGTTVWVVDANKNVYVYRNHGVLQGSWSAGGLSSSATLTGIATNGTDVWLVDSSSDKVYKYTGAATRLSGSQNAASSFKLAAGKNGDPNPQDIVADGTTFWVVDGTALKVFKYTLSGSLLGSWGIDPADAHPTGIAVNLSNATDVWIADNGTDKVYQYVGAAGRTSGSQAAAATFALNPYDTNPQGIADPPTYLVQTPAAAPPPLIQPSAAASNAGSSAGPSPLTSVPSLTSLDAAFALNPSGTDPQGIADPPPDMLLTPSLGPLLLSQLSAATPSAVSSAGPATVTGVPSLTSGDAVFVLKALDPSPWLTPGSSGGVPSDRGAGSLPDSSWTGEDGPTSQAAADALSAGPASDAAAGK
jgi:hypothetical protein